MARSSRYLVMMSSVLVLSACGGHGAKNASHSSSDTSLGLAPSAQAQPVAKESMAADEAARLGAARGVISPRLADCEAHCAKQLGDVKRAMSEQLRTVFTQSCRKACEKQMAGSPGPAPQRAHEEAANWQSLYMMTMLLEQSVFCIGKLGDQSAEARALVNALDVAKKTREAIAADDLERQAGELAGELRRTDVGRRVEAAYKELARVNQSNGPRSAEADAAREATTRARAVAAETALGKRVAEFATRAQSAREKANQTAAAAAASRAWEAHNAAFRARAGAASKAEQERMLLALTECFEAFGEQSMRNQIAGSTSWALQGGDRAGEDGPGTKPAPQSTGIVTKQFELASPAGAEFFGVSVAVEGSLLAVGAIGDSTSGKRTGRAYLYRRGRKGWTLETTLAPDDLPESAYFGQRVAIDAGRVVVTSASRGNAAYVFERLRGKWTQTAKLTAPEGELAQYFGHALDIEGDVIAVGANRAAVPGLMNVDQLQYGDPRREQPAAHVPHATWAGAVYVFRKAASGWVHEARLTPNDHESGLEFGAEVDIDGQAIAVNSGYAEYYRGGHVYVFRRTGEAWTQEAHLTHPSHRPNGQNRFGCGIALDGDVLVASSIQRDGRTSHSELFIYRRALNDWRLERRLTGLPGTTSQPLAFGSQVAIDGPMLVTETPGQGAHVITVKPDDVHVLGLAATTQRFEDIDVHHATGTLVVGGAPVSIFALSASDAALSR
jgi:hypothetical protein